MTRRRPPRIELDTITLPDGPAPGARRHIEQSMFPELRAHKAVGPLVPSVITGTNADLIDQIRHLGYIDGNVIDLTYSDNGGWWKRWRPEKPHHLRRRLHQAHRRRVGHGLL